MLPAGEMFKSLLKIQWCESMCTDLKNQDVDEGHEFSKETRVPVMVSLHMNWSTLILNINQKQIPNVLPLPDI